MANIGLYTGSSGLLIVQLLLKKTGISNNPENILKFISEISDNIHTIDSLSFDNGLTGIGWALEWCAQHHLLEINSDEILADIDDLLYRHTVYSSMHTVSPNELIGYANYFYRRALSHNNRQNRLRHICHRECLFLLLEDIKRNQIFFMNEKYVDRTAQMHFLSTYFLLLSKLLILNDKELEAEFYSVANTIQSKISTIIHSVNSTNRIDMPLLYATAKLHELFLIVTMRTRYDYWYVQEKSHVLELKQIISTQRADERNAIDELILCALHHLHTKDKKNIQLLSGMLENISFMQLPKTLYRGKGIIEIIRILGNSPQKNKDIDELLLL